MNPPTFVPEMLVANLQNLLGLVLGVLDLFTDQLHVDGGPRQAQVKLELGAVHEHHLITVPGGMGKSELGKLKERKRRWF